ncbi:MauE/DoxX family redox-associated membrane protein [uncultured Flavobacterium sp.]|uniref:MauE/DoxX family redox-associated membrane protein n=1 Tax=uncultured Flavobacterium sp. TaxID=165435 RepID=UPI0025992D3D|nr:MauE/DoxX family redox-associated membrane protein [uncultured Flavobacterium sp.]
MKPNSKISTVFQKIICLLYVMLFVYAAVSKLLDFENFQVQLGQSPLLSSYAAVVSWLVPLTELSIAFVLFIPKWRTYGFYACLSMMTMFTAYIYIVLHYSTFVPCSCGGILEKMSWNIHLLFNIFFVLIALIAICLNSNSIKEDRVEKSFPPAKWIPISILSSTILIIVLFLSSEEIMEHKNPFIRRYIKRTVQLVHSKDLIYNSYYFSGSSSGKLYLGNYTTPLQIMSIDTSFRFQNTNKIEINDEQTPFRTIKVLIRDNYFFLMDGSVPYITAGRTEDWKISTKLKGLPYFTVAEPIDTSSFIFRNNNGIKSANILGIYSANKSRKVQYMPGLLKKQIDGIFDTDGMLHYSKKMEKSVYVYFYRNEIMVAEKNGNLDYRGKTIDTFSRVKIKVSYLKDKTVRKMSAPPLTVNSLSTLHNNLLFIESKIPGQYEDPALWKYASIIDVYDISKNSYVLSFPIFKIGDDKLKSLHLTERYLYVLIGAKVLMYELKENLKSAMQNDEPNSFK